MLHFWYAIFYKGLIYSLNTVNTEVESLYCLDKG